ncbi:MAG: glycosyltransferase family 39 protein [Elusimicrobia bacterium]|nr:glycosyltransferase family 39 protein [Elusimicrobiota bacterium]
MRRNELLAGLALALLLRLGFTVHAYYKADQPTPMGYAYEPIARGLLASGVYSNPPGGVPTASREPGYILFIYLIYKVFGDQRIYVYLVQVLLSTLTTALLYDLTKRLFSPVAARFAFWSCVFYPYFIYYTAYFCREVLLAFLLVSILLLLVRWKDAVSAAAAGSLAGWLCLANGAWALGCAWSVLALYATEKPALKFKRAAAFAAPVVLLIGLWAGRNWRVFHEVIPFSSDVGGEIYIAMTIPYELLGSEEQTRLLGADERFQAISKLDELSRHKAYMAAAKDYFLAHPARFLARQAEHALKMWRPLPHTRGYTHSYLVVAGAALASDGWLIPLALFGLWLKRRDANVRWFLVPMVVLVTGAFSISQSPIRYRVPLVIIVLMLAGAGFEELWKRHGTKLTRALS